MYAGVEGGGTKTKVSIVSKEGKVLGAATGPHSNQWRIGVDETTRRISTLIEEAKAAAGLQKELVLDGVGMALSGIDTEESKITIESAMMKTYPKLMKAVHVWNDSFGAIGAFSDKGGMVLIAGTGSICVYVDGEGKSTRVGGFGHMLASDGSAYAIVFQAVKTLIDDDGGIKPSLLDISAVKKVVYDYFKTDYAEGLLEHFYTTFDATHVAKMCVPLAKAAEDGDPLSRKFFYEAGYDLARHVMAMIARFKLVDVKVLCVGSVWDSWNLLKEGFLDGMIPKFKQDMVPGKFALVRLKVDPAIGAAILSAKETGVTIPMNYEENYSIFYEHNQS